jgi:hypothetical protein
MHVISKRDDDNKVLCNVKTYCECFGGGGWIGR